MHVGVVVAALLVAAAAAAAASLPPPLDLAEPADSLRYWLQHPTLGEAGFDSTVQHASNPIYKGRPPWAWPVNGILGGSFRNKPTVMYIGLYRENYAPGSEICNLTSPASAECAMAMLKLESNDHGALFSCSGHSATGLPRSVQRRR